MWTAMNNTEKKERSGGVDSSTEIAIHTPQQIASSQNRNTNEIVTASSNTASNKENNALILHSPILSLLPNSNIKVCFYIVCLVYVF